MIFSLLIPPRPATVLVPPTLGALTPTSTTALTVNWTNGDATAYPQVWRDGVLVHTGAKGATSWSNTGLTAGVSYTYRLRHINGALYSPFTANKGGYTIPAAPTIISALATGDTVNLEWSLPNGLLSTRILRGGLIHTAAPGVSTYADTGLANGSYSYTVQATDGTYTSGDSNTASATVAVVAPPTNLAKSVTGRDVTLTWTNGAGGNQTRIYRDGALITAQVAGITTYIDAGLANGTYSYTACHWDGASESTRTGAVSATVNVSALSVPTGLTLDNTAYADRVTVSWTKAETTATQVWRDGGSGYTLIATPATNAFYVDDGLTVTHAYSYKVRHYTDASTFSDYTSPASLTTATPTLSSVAVVNSYALNKFTITFATTNMPLGGTVNVTSASDDTGLNVGYGPYTDIASPYEFAPSGFTITKSGTGPSSGTLTISSLKLKNSAGTTLVTSGSAATNFDYDGGEP